jgi:hypothetical protein
MGLPAIILSFASTSSHGSISTATTAFWPLVKCRRCRLRDTTKPIREPLPSHSR